LTESPIREFGDTARLYDALAAAQGSFPVIPKLHKAKIKAGFEYNYADIADVLAAVRPALSANGLAILQMPHPVGDRIMLVTRLAHKTGAWIESDYPVAGIAGGINHQTIGGALTYGKRYSLCAMLGVSAEDDLDGRGQSDGADPQNAPWPQRAEPPRRTPPAAQTAPAGGDGRLDPTQSHGGAAASGTGDTTHTTAEATKKKSLIDPADPLIVNLKANLANWETLRRWHETNRPLILARDEAWQNDFYALYDFRASELKKAAGLVETPKT
jgi:hypothetical protein